MLFTHHTSRAAHPTPAVFLDRDGTTNIEKNHLFRIEDWEWINGAPEAIRRLNQASFKVVVVSNQAGIARGLYGHKDVEKLHAFILDELKKMGAWIDAFYYCPHHPDFGDEGACSCRKPAPGLILRAAADLNIDLRYSWMIGDKLIDARAGLAAGTKPVLVRTGYGEYVDSSLAVIADDLGRAVEFVLAANKQCPVAKA